jgi:hypothetical protein
MPIRRRVSLFPGRIHPFRGEGTATDGLTLPDRLCPERPSENRSEQPYSTVVMAGRPGKTGMLLTSCRSGFHSHREFECTLFSTSAEIRIFTGG